MSLRGKLEKSYGMKIPYTGQSEPVSVAKKTILDAAIKTLAGTPVVLVAAPGASRLIQFISAVLVLTAGTNGLTESTDNLIIDYDGGSGITLATIEATGFIDQTVDTITNAIPVLNSIAANTACVNKNIVLLNNSGEFAGGAAADAVLTVFTTYKILDLS